LARQFIWNGVTVSQATQRNSRETKWITYRTSFREHPFTRLSNSSSSPIYLLISLCFRSFSFCLFFFVLFRILFYSFFLFKFALVMMAIKCVHTHARCWQCSRSSARMLAGFDWLPPIIKKKKKRDIKDKRPNELNMLDKLIALLSSEFLCFYSVFQFLLSFLFFFFLLLFYSRRHNNNHKTFWKPPVCL
jgi:hypothetical protein